MPDQELEGQGLCTIPPTLDPPVDATALAKSDIELRAAFSHLNTPGESICSWLTQRQGDALRSWQQLRGLQPRKAWAPEQLPGASQHELELLGQFRQQLEAEGVLGEERSAAYCCDLVLLQYLRARDCVLERAHRMLLATLAWRARLQPWALENVSSRLKKRSSDARIIGFDPEGRVVVYSSFSRTEERQPDQVTLNASCMMEKARLCAAAGSSGQVMWVNHFCGRHRNGFGWRDANPRFVFSGVSVFMDHFPECLRTMVIVDPPAIFHNLWAALKPILPPKTQTKAEFIDSRAAAAAARFQELFGADLGAHIWQLVQEDRAL